MNELTINDLGKRTLEIIEFYMQNPTMTYAQIGEKVGVSGQRVGQILRNPRAVAVFPILARRHLKSNILPKALKRYEKLIESSSNDAVAEKAAGKVLQSEKVFDAPVVRLDGEIRLLPVRVLQENIQKAAHLGLSDVVDGEIVTDSSPDTTQDTTQS